MTKLLHLSHTDIRHDGRILKEMSAAVDSGYSVFGVGILLNEGTSVSGLAHDIEIKSFDLVSKRWRSLPNVLRHLLVFLEFSWRAFFIAKSFRPSLIHCNDTLVLPLGLILKLFTGARVVYDAHELESNRNGLSPWLGKLVLRLEQFLWRYIDGLIVVSPSIEDWYYKCIGAKLSCVVMNSPILRLDSSRGGYSEKDYLRSHFSIPEEELVFIYVGILGVGRGIELILEAFTDSRVGAHVVFLGYGEMSYRLEELSEEYTNIHVHQAVPHEDVVDIVSSADWGLCLIENVSLSDFYSLPNKLFEYAFSGVRVLASDFPDINKVVSDFALGTTCDLNKEAVISAIHSIQCGPDLYDFDVSSLVPLSWDFQAKKLMEFYAQVLNTK